MKKKTAILMLLGIAGLALSLVIGAKLRPKPARESQAMDIVRVSGLSKGELVALPQIQDLQGNTQRLQIDAGKRMLFIVFSSSCEACKTDSTFWKQLAQAAESKQQSMVLLCLDQNPEGVARFVDTFGLSELPVVFDKYGEAAHNFKIKLVPQYLILNDDGRVVGRWMGLSHFNLRHERTQDPQQILNVIDLAAPARDQSRANTNN